MIDRTRNPNHQSTRAVTPRLLRFPEAGDYGCVRVSVPLCQGREPRPDWDEAVADGLIRPAT